MTITDPQREAIQGPHTEATWYHDVQQRLLNSTIVMLKQSTKNKRQRYAT